MTKRFPCKDEKMILKQNIRFRIIDTFGMNNRQVYIKIALIGSWCSGKTAFIERLKDYTFNKCYFPTNGYNITYVTRYNVTYEFYDFAGTQMYCFPQRDPEFYKMFDFIFLMIDSTHRHSIKEGLGWLHRVNSHNIPTLKIRNKCEINGDFEFRNGDGCVNISTKTGQGVEDVLKLIVKQ